MKTILISPYQRDLTRVPDEVEDVANLLNARIVQGTVDLARFFRELSGGQWELIWIASHGNEEGIQLSDGIISGDTLAAATACALAHGFSVPDAVAFAKSWVTECIRNAYPLGHGHGPVNPLFRLADGD